MGDKSKRQGCAKPPSRIWVQVWEDGILCDLSKWKKGFGDTSVELTIHPYYQLTPEEWAAVKAMRKAPAKPNKPARQRRSKCPECKGDHFVHGHCCEACEGTGEGRSAKKKEGGGA